MNLTEYLQHVEYALKNDSHLSRILVSNYFDWRNRATLASCLARCGKPVPAIELYQSIVPIKTIPSETEQKIRCLKELAKLLQVEEANIETALPNGENGNLSGTLNENLVRIEIDKKYGFADVEGKIRITPVYDWVNHFSEGLACVKLNDKWGYINTAGDIVKDFQLEKGSWFSKGLAYAKENGVWGYLDTKGTWVIAPKYDFAYAFSGGFAEVQKDGNKFFIDTNDEFILSVNQYEDVGYFCEGLLNVSVKESAGGDEKYGFIDKTGQIIIPLRYDNTGCFYEGLCNVEINGKWGYIDKTANWVINPVFELARRFSEGLAPVKINGKWGYINPAGNMVIEPEYDQAGFFRNGQASVEIFGDEQHSGIMLGKIDREGRPAS